MRSGFKRVIVLFNIPSAFEATFLEQTSYLSCADKIDAALWFGYTGGEGLKALGSIFNGDVNPSGRTVDTWSADFTKDPTFVNFGTGPTPDDTDKYDAGLYYFVDYEEGIYVGYRYYETRGKDDAAWYNQNVVYPFGYGLSYTDFSWEVESVSSRTIKKDEDITVKVKVTNTGDVAGKEVVELYAQAPYTAGGIEKAHKVLVGFAKTEEIRAGGSDTVEITFSPYNIASYDYRDANNNGFAGYELEAGTYNLYVSRKRARRGLPCHTITARGRHRVLSGSRYGLGSRKPLYRRKQHNGSRSLFHSRQRSATFQNVVEKRLDGNMAR